MELPAAYAKNCVPFKQRELGVTDPEVEYGVCVGLSVDWVTRHKNFKSEGSAKRIAYIRSEAKASAVLRQKAYIGMLRNINSGIESAQVNELDAAMAASECGFSASLLNSRAYLSADPDGSLHPLYTGTSVVNSYYLIFLSFRRDHHCIAAYHSGGKLFGLGSHLYVFEPNFGEIKIAGSESGVKGFFKGLAGAYEGYTTKAGARSAKYLDHVTIAKLSDTFSQSRGRSAAIGSRAA